jgi:cytochrome P450 PksS
MPLTVICELLGLPLADREKFMAWADGATNVAGALGFLRMFPGIYSIKRYVQQHIQSVRDRGGEGLIADLVRMEKEGAPISRDEMVAMVFPLLFAGSETTTHLISGSVFELLKDPDKRRWLQEDPSRYDLAIEEFLRFVSPVQFSKPRYVHHDVTIDGVSLKKGEKVMAMIGAANMDPAANACPHKLDLARKPNRHIAFGTGIHFCLGHQLARIEGKQALRALFDRWPDLELAVDASEVRWRQRPGLRALVALPVRARAG